MPRKIELAMLIFTVVGVVVGFAAWRWPAMPKSEPASVQASAPVIPAVNSMPAPRATLVVSGSAVHVMIKTGPNGAWYRGGELSSASSTSTIYLPIGQQLYIDLTGAASLIEVESALMPYVQVQNSAAAARVVEI